MERLEAREPDPIIATGILMEIPQHVTAMVAAFRSKNEAHKKLPLWREFQILNFLKYLNLYGRDLVLSYKEQRVDAVAQATRNLLELCIWTEFCEMSEENAKRFSDDAARDMRDLMEAVQALYVSVNKEPEPKLAGMIGELKANAPSFDIKDIDAEYMLVNNAAGVVGRQLGHAKFYKAASKFAHPTALLLCIKDAPSGLLDSFYEVGAKSTQRCLQHIEQAIKNTYPDFHYQSARRA